MSSFTNIISLALILIVLFLISSQTQSATNDMSFQSICKSTPYPSHCMSNIPRTNTRTNVRDYSRLFVQKSLASTTQLLSLINSFLTGQRRRFLPGPVTRALEDCRLLAELNLDTLSKTYQTLNYPKNKDNPNMGRTEVEDTETWLSAVLTNQQTCLDGLQEVTSDSSVRNNIFTPMSNGTRLCSISLALFKQAWASGNNKKGNVIGQPRKLLQTVGGTDLGGVSVSQRVVVNPDGSGDFTTINDAVNSAPNRTTSNNVGSRTYFLIYVVRGVYEEYVSIARNKQNLMLIGDGINQTIITGNRNVVDGWTTFNSATFAVLGQGFVAINITIRNTAGAAKHQAVALRNGADFSAFYRCSFEGYQDTLYVHSLRQFYGNCDIYGTVDFIFGNAATVLQNCNIYPRLPMANQFNAITAQGRSDPNQNTGISIHNCNVRASDDLASSSGATKTYLGRPWKEYSRTVFMQSFLGGLIEPSGWREWSGDFALSTLYYAEFGNTGPGSSTSGRVSWTGYQGVISASDAMNFTVDNFILGDSWLSSTSSVIPFTDGLL